MHTRRARDSPQEVRLALSLDLHFLAARIAHEYAADLHYELAELHADDVHTRKLLSDSANVILREMPRLTGELRSLEREWEEQELLDPVQAERTVQSLKVRWGAGARRASCPAGCDRRRAGGAPRTGSPQLTVLKPPDALPQRARNARQAPDRHRECL